MSLVRPPDMSTKSYGNTKVYSLQGGNTNPGLSAHQLYSSDKHKFYMDESFDLSSYDAEYLLDSPSEEVVHSSASGIVGNHFESDYMASQSSDRVEYDREKLRTKIQELEHVLFDDNEDEFVFGDENSAELEGEWGNPVQDSMELEGEWGNPVQDGMVHDSPKESRPWILTSVASVATKKYRFLLTWPTIPGSCSLNVPPLSQKEISMRHQT